ncbi:hypothetical protein ABZV34_37520 [Streptomyces sp. NPDC005195]|uniref:nSTAND3 domain-containing NTPase n=1 Tax=Streptomyces sp. NPDC005195 TaxID=3154561 RepID=UPI0033BF45F8
MTSRSYIYNEARPLLKSYAYPRLQERHVTVDVADLTRAERQQILYNHLGVLGPVRTGPGTIPARARSR